MKKTGSVRSALINNVVEQVTTQLEDTMNERLGGHPSEATQERLMNDEIERPVDDVDFFEFCNHAFVQKGEAITYYLKKDGAYLTTLKHPTSWDEIRKKFGPGVYMVQCKSLTTGAFKKQKTESLSELPEEDVENEAPTFFGQGQSSNGNDMSAILALMQTQNERADSQRREDRLADEQRRRDDKEADLQRRKDSRETLTTLLTALAPLAAPIIANILAPKEKDKSSEVLLEVMKDNMARIERMMDKPKENGPDAMALMKMKDDAYYRGREDEEKTQERIKDLAEERAEELAEKGKDGDESITTTLIKSLGPALATALATRGPVTAPTVAEQPALEVSAPEAVVNPTAQTPPPVADPDAEERQTVMNIVFPLLAETLGKIAQGVKMDPASSAKETLQLLREKGFSQKKVLRLFPRETLFSLARANSLPSELDPWFNDYYAALSTPPSVSPQRLRTKTHGVSRAEVTRPRATVTERTSERVGSGHEQSVGNGLHAVPESEQPRAFTGTSPEVLPADSPH